LKIIMSKSYPTEIPVIDIGGLESGDPAVAEHVAALVARALETVGFFWVVGHPVDWPIVTNARAAGLSFFRSPPAVKESVARDRLGGNGYAPDHAVFGREGAAVSVNENWAMTTDRFVGREPNKWPAIDGFKEAITAYFQAASTLADLLMGPLSLTLGMPKDHFSSVFRDPFNNMIMRYYPSSDYKDGSAGIHTHSDGNFITILPDNEVPGLEVRVGDDSWIKAPSVPQGFIINCGSVLRVYSNDRFLAAEHRVFNVSGRERIALPVFTMPTPGEVVAPVAGAVSTSRPSTYAPVTYDPAAYQDPDDFSGIIRHHKSYEVTDDAVGLS
jgi:isopenicillin N synthase-like dioxygenase